MKNLINTDFELFSFFEMTPDLVCIAGKNGYFKKVNPAVIEKLEYSMEELYASPIESFMHPEDKAITLETRAEMIEGKALLNFVNRYITKSGKIVWLEWTSIYSAEKEIVFAIAKDVTVRKLIEKEVEEKYKKFKSLATHFKSSIEQERKYLAYELHEELAQLVSAVKMDIDWIAQQMPELPGTLNERLEHVVAVSALLIKSIQRISFSLSPQMLDDFGLNATLDWLCKEFSILNGIPCNFISAYDEQSLTEEIRLDFFRICQDALSNVIDHANAGRVNISIETIADTIELRIVDNGKGFDVAKHKQSYGLANMRERAASINGQFVVQSEEGKGTMISVIIARDPGI